MRLKEKLILLYFRANLKAFLALAGAIFILSFSDARALQDESSFLGYDKLLHFTAGYLLSDAAFTIQKNNNALLPLLLPTAIGTGKEIVDSVFDWKDLACTGLGAAVRVFVSLSGAEEFHFGSITLEHAKLVDFAAGYMAAELVFMIQKSDEILLPVLIPASATAGKELVDGHFDWKDFGYVSLGAVVRSLLRASFKF